MRSAEAAGRSSGPSWISTPRPPRPQRGFERRGKPTVSITRARGLPRTRARHTHSRPGQRLHGQPLVVRDRGRVERGDEDRAAGRAKGLTLPGDERQLLGHGRDEQAGPSCLQLLAEGLYVGGMGGHGQRTRPSSPSSGPGVRDHDGDAVLAQEARGRAARRSADAGDEGRCSRSRCCHGPRPILLESGRVAGCGSRPQCDVDHNPVGRRRSRPIFAAQTRPTTSAR